MGRPAAIEVSRLQWRGDLLGAGSRAIPEEVPVALTYNGSTYAVMMATPADIADFALGFSLTEGVAADPSEIESLDVLEVRAGVEARMWLTPAASARNQARRRLVLGPTGCGLCGVDGVGEAEKPCPAVGSVAVRVSKIELALAMEELRNSRS